jgi:hypothetical protein
MVIGYNTNPSAIPSEIEYVSGMPIIIKKAGADIAISSQLMSFRLFAIKTPTSTKAGAVTCDVTTDNSGEKSRANKNNMPVKTDDSPERPPTAIPEDDSI